MKRLISVISALLLTASLGAEAAPNLLTNGGFEDSSSVFTTPTGWTSIGHIGGVQTYAASGEPAYEGNNFYDLGAETGYAGPVGDGISQDVATTIGASYTLQFGLSSENVGIVPGALVVTIGGSTFAYSIPQTSTGVDRNPFTTETLNFIATSTSTTIAFTEGDSGANGSNDPLIDGVSFSLAEPASTTVPEPGSIALLGLGVTGLYFAQRGRKRVATTAA